MDALVRRYTHENLSYRFVILTDGKTAYALEAAIKGGKWESGKPPKTVRDGLTPY